MLKYGDLEIGTGQRPRQTRRRQGRRSWIRQYSPALRNACERALGVNGRGNAVVYDAHANGI